MDAKDQNIAGKFVTKIFDYGRGRQVTVYVPPDEPKATVYAGDGQRIAQWGKLLEQAGDIVPATIVGVHSLAEEVARLHEYSPSFDPERFAAHEKFFVEDVRAWVASQFATAFPPERTAIYGASAGGELALALGLRHSDIYGVILCASPGAGYKPTSKLPKQIPRTYLVAGNQEPFFAENARRWRRALQAAGADIHFETREGSHGGKFWQSEFPLMMKWAFGTTDH